MRALIVETGRRISPFGDKPHDAAYAGGTVGEAVRGALARRGFEVIDVAAGAQVPASTEPTLVLADHTFVSDKCLGDFLDAALTHIKDAPVRLALEMAAHEETERRALEGELAALEQMWRDAEEIAAIADDLTLPDKVTKRLERLLEGR